MRCFSFSFFFKIINIVRKYYDLFFTNLLFALQNLSFTVSIKYNFMNIEIKYI